MSIVEIKIDDVFVAIVPEWIGVIYGEFTTVF